MGICVDRQPVLEYQRLLTLSQDPPIMPGRYRDALFSDGGEGLKP